MELSVYSDTLCEGENPLLAFEDPSFYTNAAETLLCSMESIPGPTLGAIGANYVRLGQDAAAEAVIERIDAPAELVPMYLAALDVSNAELIAKLAGLEDAIETNDFGKFDLLCSLIERNVEPSTHGVQAEVLLEHVHDNDRNRVLALARAYAKGGNYEQAAHCLGKRITYPVQALLSRAYALAAETEKDGQRPVLQSRHIRKQSQTVLKEKNPSGFRKQYALLALRVLGEIGDAKAEEVYLDHLGPLAERYILDEDVMLELVLNATDKEWEHLRDFAVYYTTECTHRHKDARLIGAFVAHKDTDSLERVLRYQKQKYLRHLRNSQDNSGSIGREQWGLYEANESRREYILTQHTLGTALATDASYPTGKPSQEQQEAFDLEAMLETSFTDWRERTDANQGLENGWQTIAINSDLKKTVTDSLDAVEKMRNPIHALNLYKRIHHIIKTSGIDPYENPNTIQSVVDMFSMMHPSGDALFTRTIYGALERAITADALGINSETIGPLLRDMGVTADMVERVRGKRYPSFNESDL